MNYAKLYAIVCGAVSDAVELMDAGDVAGARECLLAALEKTEELYIRGERETEALIEQPEVCENCARVNDEDSTCERDE